MGMMKAARLCPQAIVLPVDFDEVRRYSRAFKAVIQEIAPVMEDRGVDEVYIDFTEVPGGQREGPGARPADPEGDLPRHRPHLLARGAQQADREDGERVREAERHLGAARAGRAGPHLAAAGAQDQRHRALVRSELHRLHLHTIGDIAAQPRDWLIDNFGQAYGGWMHDAAWGRDDGRW